MKKTIILAAILFSLTATAQKKDEIKIQPPAKNIATMKAGSDTLEIADAVKFIKVGSNVIAAEKLKAALIIMDAKDVEGLLSDIAEYPAKFANPFSQFFLKRFGVVINQPKQ